MQIRKATIADVPELNRLVNSAYRGDSSRVGWTTEADLLDGIRTSEAALQEMIQNPAVAVLVAEDENGVVGCVYLEKKRNVLYLGMLTVKPSLQAKGIGASLMQAAEEHARMRHCQRIQMTVITARESLIHYYQRKGFRDTGERAPFPDDPAFGLPKQKLEFMVMEKEL